MSCDKLKDQWSVVNDGQRSASISRPRSQRMWLQPQLIYLQSFEIGRQRRSLAVSKCYVVCLHQKQPASQVAAKQPAQTNITTSWLDLTWQSDRLGSLTWHMAWHGTEIALSSQVGTIINSQSLSQSINRDHPPNRPTNHSDRSFSKQSSVIWVWVI